MQRPATMLRDIICTMIVVCLLPGAAMSWASGFYLPPSPSYRYITLSAPLFPTSPEACEVLRQDFAAVQQELHAQHEQCLRDAPDEERGDDGGTCSKLSCQSLHTARDEAGKKAQHEVGVCRERLHDYLSEKRREDERTRRAAEEAERDRRDQERRYQDRDRDQRNTERKNKEERDRQDAKEKADRERRDAEDQSTRERQDERSRQAGVEQQRRQAEVLRQAHFRAVTQTAGQLKTTWQDRIRNTLPETASDLSSFMKIVHGMTRGDGSYKLTDLVVASDQLLERAETAYQWITSPVQTFSDQVTADAIDMVRADRGYQRDDPRIHTIFRGIHKINELAHDTNPFTKAISSAAFDQIEYQFKMIMGELEHLETEIGSFNYTNHKHAERPIANPFKGTRSKRNASTVEKENPFYSSSAMQSREPAPSAQTGTSSSPASTNPFRTVESGSAVVVMPTKPKLPQPAIRPTDATVRYRDPGTGQLSTKRRSGLPASVIGDDPDGTRCSKDGLGIVTEKCEQRRRTQSSKTSGATR